MKADAVAADHPEPYWLFCGRDGGLATKGDERMAKVVDLLDTVPMVDRALTPDEVSNVPSHLGK